MEGGSSLLFKKIRVLSFGKLIPLSWWIPQKERALLAFASTVFWVSSILQALRETQNGTSILAFYGLGLVYVLCGMANVADGARKALANYRRHAQLTEQPRALVQLYGILASMVFFNTIVLVIYLQKGVTLTPLDLISIGLAGIAMGALFTHYGLKGMVYNPFARGYFAIACKALPQILLGGLFLLQNSAAMAFTPWALGSLYVLAGLRFWPSVLAFRRNPKSKPLQGLLIGEAGNMISLTIMAVAWLVARL